MPLPAALAARLAKRGIVSAAKVPEPKQDAHDVVEEVFAEEYDDPRNTENPAQMDTEKAEEKEEQLQDLIHEVNNCPNKWNQYHTCVDYCMKRWGLKKFKKKIEMEPKRLRMLRRFPLPEGWKEVGDPATGRYYYWNTITDEVSWLSPRHPKCRVSQPAEKIKELIGVSLGRTDDAGAVQAEDNDGMEYEEEKSASEDEEDMEDDFEELERQILQEKAKREKERKAKERGGSKKKDEELDPMDPASYSDIPRGTWSTGLERKGMAKTGVDATANGPLFQQRPYPSPGAVLRANRESQK